MDRIKILYIHHSAGWGGAPNSMIKTIEALDKTIYEPFVLLLKNSIVKNKLDALNIPNQVVKSKFYKKYYFFIHIATYHIPFYNLPKIIKLSLFWILSRYYFASKELSDIDFDIVHINTSQLSDWLKPCKQKGKVIVHLREPLSKGKFGLRYSFFRRQMSNYADKIIAISKDNAKRLNLPAKTKVIYNFSEISKTLVNVSSYKSKKVLYLGGEVLSKGFFTMVNALDYLDSGITVYFGGNYSDLHSKALKQRVKRILGYGKKRRRYILKVESNQNAEKIGMIYNVSDYLDEVCCLVSPFVHSHFARPVIEAYLNKKPVIGTDVDGMDEIIYDRQTGLLVPVDNPKELANAINYLTNNPDLAQEWGEDAYKMAIKKFTPENIHQIMDVYKELQ